jgi:hypothetical protein
MDDICVAKPKTTSLHAAETQFQASFPPVSRMDRDQCILRRPRPGALVFGRARLAYLNNLVHVQRRRPDDAVICRLHGKRSRGDAAAVGRE